jgi:hypothetical protein
MSALFVYAILSVFDSCLSTTRTYILSNCATPQSSRSIIVPFAIGVATLFKNVQNIGDHAAALIPELSTETKDAPRVMFTSLSTKSQRALRNSKRNSYLI